ncbi:MAG: hypothetical protein AAFY06_00035 [Pseudomonadota bacterium]
MFFWRPKGEQFLDDDGDPLVGGYLQFRDADTDVHLPAFKDFAGNSSHQTSITLDSAGRLPDPIYLDPVGDFKELLYDADDTLVYSGDDYSSNSGGIPGPPGTPGLSGDKGDKGDKGDQGDEGAPGQGLPVGGSTGQILVKASASDYDTGWANPQSGGGGGSGDVSATDNFTTDRAVIVADGDLDDKQVIASAVTVSLQGEVKGVARLGVNTDPDTTNQFAIKSAATLFDHAGAGHQQKINKASASDTAAVLFQTNFSGRAEMGLAGDDDWRLKVSSDGSTFRDSMLVTGNSGKVAFPQTAFSQEMFFNLLQDAGRFAGSPEPQTRTAATFTKPVYLTPYNGSTMTAHAKFIHDNSTYGGAQAALDAEVDALVSKLKTTKRFGVEFWVMDVTCGAGTAVGHTSGGVTRYLAILNSSTPLWPRSTLGFNLRCLSGSAVVRYDPAAFYFEDASVKTSDVFVLPADGWKQVIRVDNTAPASFVGYNNNIFRIYAEPNSQLLFAAPFLLPCQITVTPGLIVGVIPSLQAWR